MHARLLLASAIPGRLDERVRETDHRRDAREPLALLELPRGLTPAELAGGFALPDAQPLADRIEQSFLRRVRSLPPIHNGCCSRRRRSRWATSPCSGARPSDSGSDPTRPRQPRPPG